MANTIAKQFEEDLSNSVPSYVLFERLKDPRIDWKSENRFPQPKNICDNYCFYNGQFWYFEAKTYQGKSIPLKNIVKDIDDYFKQGKCKDTRVWKMAKRKHDINGVNAGLILSAVDIEETYFLDIDVFINYLEDCKESGKKSIPQEFIRSSGIRIKQFKKIKNWRYDLLSLIDPM